MIAGVAIGEGLVGEELRRELAQDGVDRVEFRRVFRQPFGSKPVGARPGRRTRVRRRLLQQQAGGRACRAARLARRVTGPGLVENNDGNDRRLARLPGPGAVAAVALFEKENETDPALVGAVGRISARSVVERPHHGDLSGLARGPERADPRGVLPRRGRDRDGSAVRSFRRRADHVARLGLRLTQVPSQADTRARVGVLPALQAGAWLAEAETPLAQHPGASRRKTGFLSCAQSHASPMALSDACDRDGRMARRQRGDERERRAIETLSCCLISQVTVLIK